MHSPSLKSAVRRIRSLAVPPDGQADRDLLARFRATRDDRAFAALVARHGPAVLGTCRRILADPHAAEDAFQATFLVLARRPAAVRKPAALGCWLHGVAVRVAMKLRGRLARQPRSVAAVEVPADPRDDVLWRDVRRVLDEEVNRLPDRLRLPVYLCYFEGKTRDEAADALGWKLTTLRGRLEDGRLRLRTRLALRGVELSAALLAVSAAVDGLAVGDALLESTVRAAGGAASEAVQTLAKGIGMTGTLGKTTLAAGAVLLALGLGVSLLGYRAGAGEAGGPGPGPGPKDPPPADKPQPPRELIVLMQAADRVWVVDPPTDKTPVPEPDEVLKGMSPPDRGYSFRFNAEALKDLPRNGHRWVVFLKSIDETDHIPRVAPVAGDKWFVPADDASLAALREYVPPCQWGEGSNGLRLGLYARPGADEPTVEVVLQNVGAMDLTVEQFRGNYFDDWPHLTFAVTSPAGKTYRVERQGGGHKDGDAPTDRVLKAGERYIHVVRLNRWLTAPDGGNRGGSAGNAPVGLFAGGGNFKVEATYQLTDGRDPPRWWIGKLTSKSVTVSIPVPGAYGEPAGDFRVRLRPVGKLKVGESPNLTFDVKYVGKGEAAVARKAEYAEVEVDGRWFVSLDKTLGEVHADRFGPGTGWPAWLTVRPDAQWAHLRDKPDAAGDPGEATKELIPFRLTPGSHTVRVAYPFGKDQRAVSNAITVEVAPDGWGDPAGGVKARLRLPNARLKAGDPLALELDLRNEGRKAWKLDADPFAGTVLVDGVPYAYSGPIDRKGNLKELKPGGELAPFVTMTIDELWRTGPPAPGPKDEVDRLPPGGAPFRLTPGKHTIRVAFPLGDTKLLPLSNAVEVTVEAPQLDPATRAMALGADRIWVVPSPTREKPVPAPVEVLKGPPADANGGGLFDLRLLPADDPKAKWIVFLLADDHKPVPEVKVWQWSQWSRPYTPETAAGIRRAIEPPEWGPDTDGLRMGLRLRQTELTAGHPVVAEVTVRNVGAAARTIDQHRYNIYDYWPRTRFEVTPARGAKWLLEKPDGPIKEEDAPTKITLKPGESYTQAMRLDRWPTHPSIPKDGTYPNVFATPGEYTLACRYALSVPLGAETWTAALASNAVKVTVRDPAKEPAWGDAVNGLRARVRLAKAKLGPDEPLSFTVDLKNERFDIRRVEAGEHRCWFILDGYKVPLDGLRYYYTGPPGPSGESKDLPPLAEERGFLTVTPDERWMRKNPGLFEFPYRRPVGKHILAVEYQADDKTRVRTPAVEFEAADDYGDPAGGMAARLRMAKTFKAGETPAFDLDLKNDADKTYVVPVSAGRCELQLDGVTYTREDRSGAAASNTSMYLGTEFVPFLKADLGGKWTVPTRTGDPGPLPLTPGKHRLRVAYPIDRDVKPVTREVEFDVVASDEWGEPAGGIRARVRLAKPKFKAGDPLAFEFDLKNTGDQTYEDGPIPMHCRIELDGAEYRYTAPLSYPTATKKLAPGKEFVPYVKVTTDQWWTHVGDDGPGGPLTLTPGRHKLRVSYPLLGGLQPTSPVVEFTVAGDEWGEPANDVRARLRLAKTKFKAAEPLTFDLDLRNDGEDTRKIDWAYFHCDLTLDGTRYVYAGAIRHPVVSKDLKTKAELAPFLTVTPDANWVTMTDPRVSFKLATGKHTLSVSYPVGGKAPAATPAVEFEVTSEDWGEAVGGVAGRLRMPKAKFTAGEKLAFELDLKNAGDKPYEPTPIPPECELHLDGTVYRHADPVSWPGSKVALKPGDELVPFLKFDMGGNWGVVKDGTRGEGHPLPLTPGKHRLRVAFPVTDKVKPLTREVEFEVAADPAKAPDLPALVAAADRIVVTDIDWQGGRPRLKPKRALKGPNNRWQPDLQPVAVPAGADQLPGETPDDPVPGKERSVGPLILFLKAEEDGVEAPKLSPAAARGWYRWATDKEIAAVVAALPKPAETGTAKGGLALALRPAAATVRAGEDVRLEVVLTADGKATPRVLQQRYNVYDYWPFLTFEVTGPDGQQVTLRKLEGAFTREDFIDEFAVTPGQDYAHVVRLNHWPNALRGRTVGAAPKDPFREPGRYTIKAKYAAPIGFQNIRPGLALYDWPFWAGELTSNPVTIEVKAAEAAWGEPMAGLSARLVVPDPRTPATLDLEVRNQGTRSQMFVGHSAWTEIEVDGAWYAYPHKPLDVLSTDLKPDGTVHRVRLHLDKEWVRKPDKPDAPPVRLDLKPGKHAVRAAYLFEQPDPKDGPLRVVSPAIEIGAAAGAFDEVRLVTEAGPVPLLYVVLTHPKADHTALEGLVVQHAAAALAEADRRTFQAGNIVFLVRDKPGDERGYVTGFSREQLDEIQKAAPADARRLAGGHAWRSTGPLPAGK